MSETRIEGRLDIGPYKGYRGRAEYDCDSGCFHGEVVATKDVITFAGNTPSELRTAFEESVDDYLDFCKSRGEEPEKPYSGKFLIRIAPELHRDLAVQAKRRDISLNQLAAERLDTAFGPHPILMDEFVLWLDAMGAKPVHGFTAGRTMSFPGQPSVVLKETLKSDFALPAQAGWGRLG